MADDFWKTAVGQSSLLRVDWKDWKKETPEHSKDIFVILRFDDGYAPAYAEYFDESFPGNHINFHPSRFRKVRVRDVGEIFLGTKEAKRLVAWGYVVPVIKLTKECPVCKMLQCQC